MVFLKNAILINAIFDKCYFLKMLTVFWHFSTTPRLVNTHHPVNTPLAPSNHAPHPVTPPYPPPPVTMSPPPQRPPRPRPSPATCRCWGTWRCRGRCGTTSSWRCRWVPTPPRPRRPRGAPRAACRPRGSGARPCTARSRAAASPSSCSPWAARPSRRRTHGCSGRCTAPSCDGEGRTKVKVGRWSRSRRSGSETRQSNSSTVVIK